jgi:hypothetical protein
MTDFRAGVREDPALVHRHSSESGGIDFLGILAPFFHSRGTTVIRNDGQILQKCFFFISRTCKLTTSHFTGADTKVIMDILYTFISRTLRA